MKVLVTGSTGFLGTHVLAALLAHGHTPRALVRRPVPTDRLETAVGDVRDLTSLLAALDGCDAVIHAAGGVSHRPDDAEEMWRVHVQGTKNVLDAARRAAVRRVVHVSTSGTHAVGTDGDAIYDERHETPVALVSRWPYYRAKWLAETDALAAPELDVVCLNPSLLLGPGDRRGEATKAVRLFLEDGLPGIAPGGVSICDVRDVAQACVAALTRGTVGERHLLGAANLSWVAFYERLGRITGRSVPAFRLPRATARILEMFPRFGADEGIGWRVRVERSDLELAAHCWYLDDRKARAVLGWAPRDPMETLRDTVADLQGRGQRPEVWEARA